MVQTIYQNRLMTLKKHNTPIIAGFCLALCLGLSGWGQAQSIPVQVVLEPSNCYEREGAGESCQGEVAVTGFVRVTVSNVTLTDEGSIEMDKCDTDFDCDNFSPRTQMKDTVLEVGKPYELVIEGRHQTTAGVVVNIPGCSKITEGVRVTTFKDGTSSESAGGSQSSLAATGLFQPGITVDIDETVRKIIIPFQIEATGVVGFAGSSCDCGEQHSSIESLTADGASIAQASVRLPHGTAGDIIQWEFEGSSLGCQIEGLPSRDSQGNLDGFSPEARITAGDQHGTVCIKASTEDGCSYYGMIDLVCRQSEANNGAPGSNGGCRDCTTIGDAKNYFPSFPNWSIGLGSAVGNRGATTGGAGRLDWRPPVPLPALDSELYSAEWLQLPYQREDAHVFHWSNSETISQLLVPDGLIQVTPLAQNIGFTVEFYRVEDIQGASFLPGGRGWGLSLKANATPFTNWVIRKTGTAPPDTRGIEIIKDMGLPEEDRHEMYNYHLEGKWEWIHRDRLFRRVDSGSTSLKTRTESIFRYENFQIGDLLQETSQTYADINGRKKPFSMTRGSDNHVRTTTYTYYTTIALPTSSTDEWSQAQNNSGRIKQIDYPDGQWERFQYTTGGRIAEHIRPLGNESPTDSNVANTTTQVTEYLYAYQAHGIPDDSGEYLHLPRLAVTKINGNETGRLYRKISTTTHLRTQEEQQAPDPGLPWDHPNNIKTITTYGLEADAANYNQVISILNPDATGTLVDYRMSELAPRSFFTTESTGTLNATKDAVTEGQQNFTVIDHHGQELFRSTRWITGSKATETLAQQFHSDPDDDNRYQTTTYLDGSTSTRQFDCCGLATETDRQGGTRIHDHNEILRQHHVTDHFGLTHTQTTDPAGRLVRRERFFLTEDTKVTLGETSYNTAGESLNHTNALGGVTITQRNLLNNQWVETTTHPDPDGVTGPQVSGTETRTYYRDGRLETTTGTATFPVRYEYGVESLSGVQRAFSKQIALDSSNLDTGEWVKTFTDGLGRTVRREYPPENGNVAAERWTYEAGQFRLRQYEDPDGVTILYDYNDRGQRFREVLDLDQDGIIDLDGTDRIIETTTTLTNRAKIAVLRRETHRYDTNSTTDKTLVSQTDSAVNGLITWQTRYRDANTPITVRYSRTTPSIAGQHTSSVNYPDHTRQVDTYDRGRLIKSEHLDAAGNPITSQTYDYDIYNRLEEVIDPRSGTTTRAYNDADQLTEITAPPHETGAAPQVTTIQYDNALRAFAVTHPDNTTVSQDYFPNGLLKKRYGSRTYPVEYLYDAQGRLHKQATWQDHDGSAGLSITQWDYHPTRGWLTKKRSPDKDFGVPEASGTTYTYTPGGRLDTRTWQRNITTTYTYHPSGDLEKIDYSDTTPDVHYQTFDRQGRPTHIQQGDGASAITTVISYNDLDQPTQWDYTGGPFDQFTTTRGYDSIARLSTIGWGEGANVTTTAYTYQPFDGRLESVTHNNHVARYDYEPQTHLVKNLTFHPVGAPDERIVQSRAYDNIYRLTHTELTNPDNSRAYSSSTYLSNTANQREKVTSADGSYWDYDYDDLGQLTSAERRWSNDDVVLGQTFTYAFDDIGNRISTGGRDSSVSTYGAPNRQNQITSRTVWPGIDVQGSAAPETPVTVNGQAATRQGAYFHRAENFTGTTPGFPAITIQSGSDTETENAYIPTSPVVPLYDDDGNLQQDGRWDYTWDAENRLIGMTSIGTVPAAAQQTLTFTYDYQGRRLTKSNSTKTFGYLYDGWNMISEHEVGSQSNNVLRTYAWGSDLSGGLQGAGGVGGLAMINDLDDGDTQHYVHSDGQGNVVTLVDAATRIASATYEYGPFGESIRATGPMADKNPFQFSTKYTDAETEHVCFGFRHYDPTSGGWLSTDPIEEAGGLNLYGFVRNDPIDFIDRNGLESIRLWQFNEASNTRAKPRSQFGQIYDRMKARRKRCDNVCGVGAVMKGIPVGMVSAAAGAVGLVELMSNEEDFVNAALQLAVIGGLLVDGEKRTALRQAAPDLALLTIDMDKLSDSEWCKLYFSLFGKGAGEAGFGAGLAKQLAKLGKLNASRGGRSNDLPMGPGAANIDEFADGVGSAPQFVDPGDLRLPPSRPEGADPFKLSDQWRRYGNSADGMLPPQVTRGLNGELMINDGVTRATRINLVNRLNGLSLKVPVEIIEDVPHDFSKLPVISNPAR